MELLDEANLANAFDFVVSPLENPQMNTRPQWGSGGRTRPVWWWCCCTGGQSPFKLGC